MRHGQDVVPLSAGIGDGGIGEPVVLVCGYGGVKSHWFLVERTLRAAGFSSVHTMRYNAWASDIPALARRLTGLVHSVLLETGARQVHLVGHSLGGVIIRYAVGVLGLDPLVGTAVTVASPHGGTPLAWLGAGRTAAQLRPGSSVLRKVAAAAAPGHARWVAFYSDRDAVVPAPSARIDPPALGAVNILMKDLGHLSILLSPQLARAVVDQLDHVGRRRRANRPTPAYAA